MYCLEMSKCISFTEVRYIQKVSVILFGINCPDPFGPL